MTVWVCRVRHGRTNKQEALLTRTPESPLSPPSAAAAAANRCSRRRMPRTVGPAAAQTGARPGTCRAAGDGVPVKRHWSAIECSSTTIISKANRRAETASGTVKRGESENSVNQRDSPYAIEVRQHQQGHHRIEVVQSIMKLKCRELGRENKRSREHKGARKCTERVRGQERIEQSSGALEAEDKEPTSTAASHSDRKRFSP
jgi:hypothetical protein